MDTAGSSDAGAAAAARHNTAHIERHVDKLQQHDATLRRGNSSPRGLGASSSASTATTSTTTTTTAGRAPVAAAASNPLVMSNADMPNTLKLLSELERSWAMFSASWKVVDLFGGMQIYQQQPQVSLASCVSRIYESLVHTAFVHSS